ncbi:MAG: outer membrane lipoprotein carrier protein LolA [Spartobacteria bacterium]|nr:outer membrane lipoprotein carrier protein LolA [Spartobacteria bacterium]
MAHMTIKNRSSLILLVLLCCPGTLCSRADDLSTLPQQDRAVLNRLENQFGGINTIKTRFTQEKELAVFNKPMVLNGWIALDNNGHFAWHVQHPLRYSLVVADGVISQWDEDSDLVQNVRLSKNPVLNAVFEQLTLWFSGRYHSFTGKYNLVVQQETPPALAFTPKPDTMEHKVISRVVIRFAADEQYINQIIVDEASGDKTTLTFHETLINPPLSQSTWSIHADEP